MAFRQTGAKLPRFVTTGLLFPGQAAEPINTLPCPVPHYKQQVAVEALTSHSPRA